MPGRTDYPVSAAFDMVKVLALSQHSERRREFSAQLRRLGLSPEAMPDLFHEAATQEHPAGLRPRGPNGRLQAHRAVLEAFLASGRESLLLIQDDAVFARQERDRIPAVLALLAARTWDLFHGEAEERTASQGPVTAFAADGPLGYCQVMGCSRRAALHLVPFLAGLAGRQDAGDAVQPAEKLNLEQACQAFRKAHPGFVCAAATPRVVHRRAMAAGDGSSPRPPLMSTFLSLGRRSREVGRRRPV